ncbi:MAG: amidohydrolase family protein [Polyangiaceae bacterium]
MYTLIADTIFDGQRLRRGVVRIPIVGSFMGRIARIEEELDVHPALDHDRRELIDVRGSVLMPGLVNAHVHIARGGGFEVDEPPMPLQAARNFVGALASGTTTVADLGSPPALLRALAFVSNAPSVVGPDVFAAGPVLTAPSGYPLDWMPPWVARLGAAVACDGPDKAKRAVHGVARAGMRFVKIAIMHQSYADKPLRALDVPTARAIVEEAHNLGLKVLAHAHSRADYRVALAVGVDGLMHSAFDPLDDDTVRAVVDSGTPVCPTLWVFDSICALDSEEPAWADLSAHLSAPVMSSLRRFAAAYRASDVVPPSPAAGLSKTRAREAMRCAAANLRLLHDAGARVVFGNDAAYGFSLVGRPADELAAMQRAGLSVEDCLRAATSEAASLLGLADRGAIAEGMRADLVVVSPSVMLDVGAVAHPSLVMKAGKIVVSTARRVRAGGPRALAKLAAAYSAGVVGTVGEAALG